VRRLRDGLHRSGPGTHRARLFRSRTAAPISCARAAAEVCGGTDTPLLPAARGAAREGEGGEGMESMLRAVGWQSRCRAADYARIGFPVTTACRCPPPSLLWADCLHLTGSARWHHPLLGRACEGRCVCHQARPSDGRPRRAGQRPRLSQGEPAAKTSKCTIVWSERQDQTEEGEREAQSLLGVLRGQPNAAGGLLEDAVPRWKVRKVLFRVDAVSPNRPLVGLHLAVYCSRGIQRVGPYRRTSAMDEGL